MVVEKYNLDVSTNELSKKIYLTNMNLSKKTYQLIILCVYLISFGLNAQVQPPNPQNCSSGSSVGNNISTADQNTNFYSGNPQLTAGALQLSDNAGDANTYEFNTTITATDLICDNYYNTGGNGQGINPNANAFPEGPDLQIRIPIPEGKRESCAGGEITIILRGDFNNTCEVAYLVDESGIILGQSQVTGFNEDQSCAQPIGVELTVALTPEGLKNDAVDGFIELQIRTNGNPNLTDNGFSGSQVDGTCHDPRRDQDTDGLTGSDGVCMQVSNFTWEIQELEPPTIDAPIQEICSGETATFNASCPECTYTTPTTNWFNAPTGGTSAFTGSSYTPANGDIAEEGAFSNINTTNAPITYTFYAENNCPANCPTERTQVQVTVFPAPEITCPSDYTIQCVSDTLPSFQNITQFLDAGGFIGTGCGELEVKCVNQVIE